MTSRNAVCSNLISIARPFSIPGLRRLSCPYTSLPLHKASSFLSPAQAVIVHVLVRLIVLHAHMLIAPRRLSRKCKKAWKPQNTKKPCFELVSSSLLGVQARRTMYINTAPNTAPATAPPSFGSSSEPMTRLLDPCIFVSICEE
jgi:hypothetical protein